MIGFGRKVLGATLKSRVGIGAERIATRVATESAETLGRSAVRGARGTRSTFRAAERIATKRGVGKASLAGLAGLSLLGGINQDRQITDPFLKLTTGSSDYDQYTLGTNYMRARMMPVNPRRFADAYKTKNRRARNGTPSVDGSVAFGMYNSRMG